MTCTMQRNLPLPSLREILHFLRGIDVRSVPGHPPRPVAAASKQTSRLEPAGDPSLRLVIRTAETAGIQGHFEPSMFMGIHI
jgi:hypothetical protein